MQRAKRGNTDFAGVALAAVIAAAPMACRSTGADRPISDPDQMGTLSLMLPNRIEVQDFTQVRSFDGDAVPDGILVVLRPSDRFGDAVKATGLFYFELYGFRNASSDHRGERLAFWDRAITTPQEVGLYWNRSAQMYQFELEWIGGGAPVVPNRKYLLAVTYRAPWDETFEDEYAFDFVLSPAQLAGSPGR